MALAGLVWVLLLAGLAPGARAQDTLSPEERGWLKGRGILHIGAQPDRPPLSFLGPQGQPQGIAVDFWRLLAAEMGIKLEFHTGNLNQQLIDLREGRLDSVCGLSDLPEWRGHFNFTSEFYRLPVSIFLRRGLSPVRELKDLWGLNLGVVQGDVGQIVCQGAGLPYMAHTGFEAAMMALARGQMDAVVMADLVAYHLQNRHGLRQTMVQAPQPVLLSHLALPLRKSDHQLLAIIDKIMKAIPINRMRAISDRWRREG